MSHGSENLKILYVLITAPWNCLIGRRETNLEIENSSGVCQKVIYMLKCLCYEETSDIVKSSHLHLNLMLEDKIWIKDLKEKKCVEQVWDMSGASSGACVRYVLGIIWGMFGVSSGACLGYVWGIIWDMSGASSGACLVHHLGHVWGMSGACLGQYLFTFYVLLLLIWYKHRSDSDHWLKHLVHGKSKRKRYFWKEKV